LVNIVYVYLMQTGCW